VTHDAYLNAVRSIDWLLHPVEQSLRSADDSAVIRASDVLHAVSGRHPTREEIAAAMYALGALGIIDDSAGEWHLRKQALENTESYRSGVRDGLLTARREDSVDVPVLLAAIPPSSSPALREVVEHNAADLRSAVVGLIAGAERRLVLASPFWDEETADELHSLLARRVEAGVRVQLLGRSVGGSSQAGQVLEELSRRLGSACRTFTWSRAAPLDPLGWETFHFKAAVADGQRAYLGTANFTVGGLRSRMELGFVTRGALGGALARILDAALSEA